MPPLVLADLGHVQTTTEVAWLLYHVTGIKERENDMVQELVKEFLETYRTMDMLAEELGEALDVTQDELFDPINKNTEISVEEYMTAIEEGKSREWRVN